ncbi:MAG: hypothetical protein ABGW66_05990 [Flavobacteriaceae bacterium]|jgi:hypothetical protein
MSNILDMTPETLTVIIKDAVSMINNKDLNVEVFADSIDELIKKEYVTSSAICGRYNANMQLIEDFKIKGLTM